MSRPIIVAAVDINHNGDLRLAKSIIAMASSYGADFVKFQKRVVDSAYTDEYLSRPKISKWGRTVRDEKLGLEFDREEFDEIDAYCKRLGIGWFASPRDPESVDFLMKYDMPFIKVASGSQVYQDLLETVRDSGIRPVLSTGMATCEQVNRAIMVLSLGADPMFLLHCVSLYPTPDEHMNMRRMLELATSYTIAKVGFSNHSSKTAYIMQAHILGAEMIEFHVTLDRSLNGPDHFSSMGPVEFGEIMNNVALVEAGWGSSDIIPAPGELEKGRHYSWRKGL